MSLNAATSPVPMCAALADESRWQILVLLGSHDLSASDLAKQLPISRQAIARHLGVLEDVGLVTSAPYGRQLRYRALGGRLSELAANLDAIGRGWERRLNALKALVEEPDKT